jgi:hypothetical protein
MWWWWWKTVNATGGSGTLSPHWSPGWLWRCKQEVIGLADLEKKGDDRVVRR